MGYGATKGREAETRGDPQDFEGARHAALRSPLPAHEPIRLFSRAVNRGRDIPRAITPWQRRRKAGKMEPWRIRTRIG
jgi:hypothetical protein